MTALFLVSGTGPTAEKDEDAGLLTPAGLAGLLPVRPVLSSPRNGWQDIVLQRYQDVPGTIHIPGLQHDYLVSHLAGPFLVKTGGGTGPSEQRWINAGQVGINPAGRPVHRVLKGKPDVVLLHLAPAKLRSVAEEMFDLDPARVTLVPKLAERDEVIEQLIRLLLAEAEAPMSGTSLMIDTLSRTLMVHTLRRYSNLAPRTPENPSSMSPGRVRHVIDYMRAHVAEALSLAQLAQVGKLSPSRFVRAFRNATGQPPYRFLVRLRIEKARELLEHTDLPVIEVGLRCGFEQPSHFATMFRKVTGLTPRAWRLERRA